MRSMTAVASFVLGLTLLLPAGERAPAAKAKAKAPEISPPARAVIEKAVGAMGGKAALAKIRGLRMSAKGIYKMGPVESPYTAETTFVLPNRLLWKLDAGPFKGSVGITGREAWSQMMAPPARAAGAMKESLMDWPLYMRIMLVRPLLNMQGATITGGEAEKQDGKTVYRVQLSLPRGQKAADPERKFVLTFAGEEKPFLAMVEGDTILSDGRKGRMKAKYSNPKAFGDVTVPAANEQEVSVDGKVEEYVKEEMVSVEWNPPAPPADFFAMPPLGLELMKAAVKDVEEAQALSTMLTGPYNTMGEKIHELTAAARGTTCMPIGPSAAIYLNDPASVKDPSELRTEIFLPVVMMGAPPEKFPAGISLKKLPGGTMAAMAARGPYGEADVKALRELFSWLATAGHQVAGPPRMIYYHDPEMTVTEDLISEVQIPIRKK